MEPQFVKIQVSAYGMPPSDEKRALELIETCGRTAYKSEDKITETSARAFVLMLKNHGHLSVLEHSNVVLKIQAKVQQGVPSNPAALQALQLQIMGALDERNAFHRLAVLEKPEGPVLAVAGNFRSWIETQKVLETKAPRLYGLFQSPLHQHFPSMFSRQTLTDSAYPVVISLIHEDEQLELLRLYPQSDLPAFVFKLICDRGITHEVVRHRVFSYTQESTRYVSYKNRGMVLMLPEELEASYDDQRGTLTGDNPLVELWKQRATKMFQWYRDDLERGLKPQIARDILPNLLKSEIFVTGRWSGWQHFVRLRESPQAHPRIRAIAREVRTYFQGLGLHMDELTGEHP